MKRLNQIKNTHSSEEKKQSEAVLSTFSLVEAISTIINVGRFKGTEHLLINNFTNTFHVKRSEKTSQSFTWNIHNILGYV